MSQRDMAICNFRTRSVALSDKIGLYAFKNQENSNQTNSKETPPTRLAPIIFLRT